MLDRTAKEEAGNDDDDDDEDEEGSEKGKLEGKRQRCRTERVVAAAAVQ